MFVWLVGLFVWLVCLCLVGLFGWFVCLVCWFVWFVCLFGSFVRLVGCVCLVICLFVCLFCCSFLGSVAFVCLFVLLFVLGWPRLLLVYSFVLVRVGSFVSCLFICLSVYMLMSECLVLAPPVAAVPQRYTLGVGDLTDHVAEAFRMLDGDGSGTIDEQELEELGRRLAERCVLAVVASYVASQLARCLSRRVVGE